MRKSKNNFYTQKKDRIIYILLSPREKIFHINHCTKTSLEQTYREIFNEKRYATNKFIKKIKPDYACLFMIEETNSSISDTYKIILVWIKILIENGYESYNYQKTIEASKTLSPANKILYDARKNISLEQMFSCKNCVVPFYKNKKCENKNHI